MKKAFIFKILIRFFGLFFFVDILSKLDWNALVIYYPGFPKASILFSLILILAIFSKKAFCWYMVLLSQDIRLFWRELLIGFGRGFFWGTITPGRIGETWKIYYVKEKGNPLVHSAVSVIVDRLLDIFFRLSVDYEEVFSEKDRKFGQGCERALY